MGKTAGTTRILAALLLPFVACGVQWLFWSTIKPFVWFFFFPTVFFSSRIGGKRIGIITTFTSAVLVIYFFIPPQLTFIGKPLGNLLSVLVFIAMGILFSLTHDRLERIQRREEEALEAARSATEQLQELRIGRLEAEQRQAEDALRKSHARLEKVLEVETVGVMFWDLTSGRLVDANNTFLDLMGYSRGEMAAGELTWQTLTPPEYYGVSAAEVEKFLVTGRVGPYEKEYLHKDGSRQWFVFAGSSLGDNSCVEFCVDISARKEAEAALRSTQEKLALAQRVAGIGTFEWNIETNVNVWSPEMEVLYGLPIGGFNGTYEGWCERIHPDDLPQAERAVRESLKTGSLESEWRIIWPDGSVRWLQCRATVLRDAAGQPERMLGANFDITDRKSVEAQIRRLNTSLEEKVRERTAELEAANRELDSFAYAVSHDLRAPLRAMIGFSEALIEDHGERLDGEAREYLEEIVIGSRHMGGLIDGLLTMSRSTRGEVQFTTLDLSSLVNRIRGELERDAPERRVAWQVEPGLSAKGDPMMVEVALRNLLSNAWKYTAHAAEPIIRVYAEENGDGRFICVSDNGAGFDMAHCDRLFKPFQRLHRQDEFPGIGIGLATVQRIVHRHGGDIQATAEPGKGATFKFSLQAP